MLGRLLTREKIAEAALFGLVEAAAVGFTLWLASLVTDPVLRDWAILVLVPAGMIAVAIALHGRWSRQTSPPLVTEGDSQSAAERDDPRLVEYESMKAHQQRENLMVGLANLINEADGMLFDYETAKPPNSHLPDLEARAWLRYDRWEEDARRTLRDEQEAFDTFFAPMPEYARQHRDWWRRVYQVVTIKVDRLKRIQSGWV